MQGFLQFGERGSETYSASKAQPAGSTGPGPLTGFPALLWVPSVVHDLHKFEALGSRQCSFEHFAFQEKKLNIQWPRAFRGVTCYILHRTRFEKRHLLCFVGLSGNSGSERTGESWGKYFIFFRFLFPLLENESNSPDDTASVPALRTKTYIKALALCMHGSVDQFVSLQFIGFVIPCCRKSDTK